MSETTSSLLHLDHELYDRLFEQRTILLGEPLEDLNTNRLCNALLVLSAADAKADIRFLINSPGGSVPGMLAIRDCMRAIPNDVVTINLGMAYSAGQFLLSSGTRGRRFTMPHARVLLHQGSAGIGGTAMDIAIQADDLRRTRDTVLGCIAEDTGQPLARIEADSRRDRWFSSAEAVDYGFVDSVITDLADVLPGRTRTIGLGRTA
ncbi:MAG: ATP-dependent Clp protease proteolytic subunit [Propionibacteriaceae bacterium]|nr:ATP-dependent Clp protease proteolytic subunit [Propionibacteriaceae bacterium]